VTATRQDAGGDVSATTGADGAAGWPAARGGERGPRATLFLGVVPAIGEDRRKRRIGLFIAVVFMAHAGLIDLWRDGGARCGTNILRTF